MNRGNTAHSSINNIKKDGTEKIKKEDYIYYKEFRSYKYQH
jgi:hypothetical protein